jgi:hypothetical protein
MLREKGALELVVKGSPNRQAEHRLAACAVSGILARSKIARFKSLGYVFSIDWRCSVSSKRVLLYFSTALTPPDAANPGL